MGRILMLAIVLYLIFLACYLVWERRLKRRRNAARKRGRSPFTPAPVEDIIGKSGFDLRHSLPQATTLRESGKRAENDSAFADGNDPAGEEKPPVAVPVERLDELFARTPTTEISTDSPDEPDNVDLAFDDGPDGDDQPAPDEETEAGSYEENVDADESGDDEDDYDAEDAAPGGAMATGLGFDELSGMSRTVNDPAAATPAERREAGRVLVEVRRTDMFEQVVSGRPEKRQTAGGLMDDFLADYTRKKREAGEMNDEPTVKAPEHFDARAFAR